LTNKNIADISVDIYLTVVFNGIKSVTIKSGELRPI
jgi:hypothetical protein